MRFPKPQSLKRRPGKFLVKPHCLARRLVLTAKVRARKPISISSTTRVWPQLAPAQDPRIQAIAPLRPAPYPEWPEEPLVDPAYWRSLPARLARPELVDVSPEKMVAAQPGYEGLIPHYVRSGWSHMGYRCMGMYRKLYIDPPKTALPEAYNLLMIDGGLVSSTTHLFAVYEQAPFETYGPAARRRKQLTFRRTVDLYPTHASIWSAYCSRLPTMPQQPTKLKVYTDPRPGARRASVLRLPIVPVAVPYPPTFWTVMQFVYTYRKSTFINLLLPGTDFALPPDSALDPPPEVTLPRFAQALARSCDLLRLCQIAKNVHGTYRNMIALGVVEVRMWEALEYAWATVLEAMDLVEKSANGA